ncbi:hypothetical protein VH567_05190 [Sphingomonas sp. 4RDLI-65]|uniref:hypothetical protein n=1 Tax=Sphingomonas sp. 4RDLI-65 TaxID=3111641 RepID=UPI003C296779
MTRHDLAVAKWKCSFLAKKIVILRQSAAEPHVLALIALHQSELDMLLAAIAKTHDAKEWAANWGAANTQTDERQACGTAIGAKQDLAG